VIQVEESVRRKASSDAFEQFYADEFDPIARAVRLSTGGAAEDATQEAFARALASWDRLEGRPWAAAWVARTALNVAKRGLRRRRPPDLPIGLEPDPAEQAIARRDLILALRSLPTRQKESIVLVGILGYSIAEAASAMSCAEGTVKAHLFAARRRLRPLLGSEGG
jgi:RNA polymerase sigma factor (sigma-70 family)